MKPATAWTALATALLVPLPFFAAEADSILPVFQESCIRCHGENGKVKGKLNLL